MLQNILEIKKAKELLNIYINEWKISKDKFNILFNKYDKDCINLNLLKNIFSEFNIIGILKYNSKYNKLINKNITNFFHNKKIRNEYLNIKNNQIENEVVTEKSQNKFLETTLGKTINSAIDIGLRWVLPDLIENEVIDVKDSLIKGGLKEGINTAVNTAINLGKSALGIFTGKFENVSQAQAAIKTGGIIDSVSNVIDTVLNKTTKNGLINNNVSNLIRQGKNVILDNVSKNIEDTFTSQLDNMEKLGKYESNWKEYYQAKDFGGMEREYEKIRGKLKELIPFENTLKEARVIENLHTIIKNNGQDFNLNKEQLELAKMLS